MAGGNTRKDIIDQLEAYLHDALGDLQIARMHRQAAEELLEQAKDLANAYKLDAILQKGNVAAQAADKAASNVTAILKLAHDLVKADEERPDKPVLNIKEIKELKEFRDIVNTEGQASEEAYAAHHAVAEIENLSGL